METESMRYIAIGLMSFAMLGAAMGIGNIFAALIDALARNPSVENKASKYAIIGAGLAEFMGLLAAVIVFILMFK
jgi:F-type H+-transporting ATPase subunit c